MTLVVRLLVEDRCLHEFNPWLYDYLHAPGSLIKYTPLGKEDPELYTVEELHDKTLYDANMKPLGDSFVEMKCSKFTGEN